jgi:hypothetical protein
MGVQRKGTPVKQATVTFKGARACFTWALRGEGAKGWHLGEVPVCPLGNACRAVCAVCRALSPLRGTHVSLRLHGEGALLVINGLDVDGQGPALYQAPCDDYLGSYESSSASISPST